MDIRSLKAAAGRSLADASYDPKKLVLIHTGASLLLSLVLTVINYLLTRSIDSTAGLTGLGTRAVLSSAQSVLSMAGSLLLPFWEIGFLYAAMNMARRSSAEPVTLAEGFRRFGPVLRLMLLEGLLYCGIALGCLYIATMLFFFSPFSNGLLTKYQEILASSTEQVVLDEATIAELQASLIPVYVIFAILFLVVVIPVFYRLRMSRYALMDEEAPGALAAMGVSGRMMRGNRISLFKLDLSFWWYYAGQGAIAVIAYADILLPMLGVTLPVSDDVLFFVTYAVHLVLQLIFAWRFAGIFHTTYAHCYDELKQSVAAPVQIPPACI